jgi:tetratricopeptide (TPR) repeat protein
MWAPTPNIPTSAGAAWKISLAKAKRGNMHNSLTMTRLRENAMKVFVWLFALLMLASAAPAMACGRDSIDFLPETYRESVRKFADSTAQELGAQDAPDSRLKLAEVLYAVSKRSGGGNCTSISAGERIAFYDEIERRFGDDKSPKIRAIVLKALIAKTNVALLYGNHVPEGNDATLLIKHRYATDNDPEIQALYVEALISWAERELRSSRTSISYDEIFERYQDSKNPGVRAAIAKALFNKASLMREEERLSRYDEIVQRFGKDDIPEVREEVINALLEKGDVLQKLGKYDEAVSHYDNFMQRTALGSEWVKFRRYASRAVERGPLLALILTEKGKALEKQGKLEQAIAAYDQAIAAYDAKTPQSQWEKDEELLTQSCRVLIAKAAIFGKQKGKQAAHAIYEDIVKRIEKVTNEAGRAGDKYFLGQVYSHMCVVNYYTHDISDACIYVFQRIGRDNPYIPKNVQRAIEERKAQQKP